MNIISDILNIQNSIGIFITESWLNSDISDAEIDIPGYSIYRSDRCNRSRGGVITYLRSDLRCVLLSTFCNDRVEIVLITCKN